MYLLYYATHDGYTGHMGVAVDNYDVAVRDVVADGKRKSMEFLVPNGTVTYFDLWPLKDVENFSEVQHNREPYYNRLPEDDFAPAIHLMDLINFGIPGKTRRLPDGLLEIKTRPEEDIRYLHHADSICKSARPYNPSYYNCTDFVIDILKGRFGNRLKAKEQILYVRFNTPNKLFRKLRKKDDVAVLIDPGDKVKGSFFRERYLKRNMRRNEPITNKSAAEPHWDWSRQTP